MFVLTGNSLYPETVTPHSLLFLAHHLRQHHQYLVPLNNDDFASARKSLIYPSSSEAVARFRLASLAGAVFAPGRGNREVPDPLADSEWSTPIISFVSTVCLPGSCNTCARPSVLQALWKSPSIRQRNLRFVGLCARWSVTYWFWGIYPLSEWKRGFLGQTLLTGSKQRKKNKRIISNKIRSTSSRVFERCRFRKLLRKVLKKKSQQFCQSNCISVQNSYRFERDKT